MFKYMMLNPKKLYQIIKLMPTICVTDKDAATNKKRSADDSGMDSAHASKQHKNGELPRCR